MEKLLHISDRLSTWAAWIGGGMLFASAVLIAIEVILRKAFSISIGGADELSSYAMAISCSWTFGYALFRKAHIRVDVLYIRFPRSFRFVLDILSIGLFVLYMLLLSYFGFWVLHTSVVRSSVANTPLATPLWIPQGLWFVGIAGFTLITLMILAGTLYYLITGNPEKAEALSGASAPEPALEEKNRSKKIISGNEETA